MRGQNAVLAKLNFFGKFALQNRRFISKTETKVLVKMTVQLLLATKNVLAEIVSY